MTWVSSPPSYAPAQRELRKGGKRETSRTGQLRPQLCMRKVSRCRRKKPAVERALTSRKKPLICNQTGKAGSKVVQPRRCDTASKKARLKRRAPRGENESVNVEMRAGKSRKDGTIPPASLYDKISSRDSPGIQGGTGGHSTSFLGLFCSPCLHALGECRFEMLHSV